MRMAILAMGLLALGAVIGAQSVRRPVQYLDLRDGAGACVRVSIRSAWPLLPTHSHLFTVEPSTECK